MIKVLEPGLLTTVQDQGRYGFRNVGVPISGVMDSISASLANLLLGNDMNDAVVETTLIGPKFEFLKETQIAITGAIALILLDNQEIKLNKVYDVKKGAILSFNVPTFGVRNYLAVKGGFKSEIILNSKSFFNEITHYSRFIKGMEIPYEDSKNIDFQKNSNSQISYNKTFFETTILEVFKGPEFHLFSEIEIETLFNTELTISPKNSRMGYYLNEVLIPNSKSIITSPVLPGTVQLIPAGNLIVLMKDAQTTGGYPRVLQLTENSICILSQKASNEKITFKLKEF